MRKILLSGAATLALAAGTAHAGGLAQPVIDPVVVQAQTSSSASPILVPLGLFLLVLAAASSSVVGGNVGNASDRRLKTDVTWVGMRDGLAVYRWRYLDQPGVFEGVMAQEMLAQRPEAVMVRGDGMLMVDYDKVPVGFRRIH